MLALTIPIPISPNAKDKEKIEDVADDSEDEPVCGICLSVYQRLECQFHYQFKFPIKLVSRRGRDGRSMTKMEASYYRYESPAAEDMEKDRGSDPCQSNGSDVIAGDDGRGKHLPYVLRRPSLTCQVINFVSDL